MSSILTNGSAMNALATLRKVNSNLTETQNRISTGLKVRSGKENASTFSISSSMKGDSGMYKAINEGLTLTKNSVSTARLGAEKVQELTKQFAERVAFAQGNGVDRDAVAAELRELSSRVQTVIDQSTFSGDNLVTGGSEVTVVTGVSRASGTFAATTITFERVDLQAIQTALEGFATTTALSGAAAQATLTSVEGELQNAIAASTSLGIAEKSIETQKDFLDTLSDEIELGVSGMIDSNMEEEAARLQALQTQQQLATQSLTIANQNPQQILSLFR